MSALPGPTTPPGTSDAFDPKAPVVDSWGIRYPDFKAFLCGHPYKSRCNEAVEAHRQKGRNQAFCKTFAEGFRSAPVEPGSNPSTYLDETSRQGWQWATAQGFVGPNVAYADSSHYARLGYGYDAVRRAAERTHNP